MVHFECLSKEDINSRTGTFSCPECKAGKMVYSNFEKLSSSNRLPREKKARMTDHNIKKLLCKEKKISCSLGDKILKSVLRLENFSKDNFIQDCRKIENIEIKRSDTGLESIKLDHGYFDL